MVASAIDLIKAGKKPVTWIRVLTGESSDPARRAGKKVVAFSDCRYVCPNKATVEACIEHLKQSDARLRERPDEMMLWDWDNTYLEWADPDDPSMGGTIILGVAWYDREFFDDRSGAWFGALHRRIYEKIGVPMENISVEHWLAAKQATWVPEPSIGVVE